MIFSLLLYAIAWANTIQDGICTITYQGTVYKNPSNSNKLIYKIKTNNGHTLDYTLKNDDDWNRLLITQERGMCCDETTIEVDINTGFFGSGSGSEIATVAICIDWVDASGEEYTASYTGLQTIINYDYTFPVLSLDLTSTKNSVTASWSVIEDNVYKYAIKLTGSGISNSTTDSLTTTSKTYTNLNSCTNYTITLSCTDKAGNKTTVNQSITTLTEKPNEIIESTDKSGSTVNDVALVDVKLNPGFKYVASGSYVYTASIGTGCSTIKSFYDDSIEPIEYTTNSELSISENTLLNSTGISEYSIARNYGVYPNPCKDILTINIPDEFETIAIYSMLGEKMLERSINSSILNLDVSKFTTGMYFVTAEKTGKSKTFKFYKQ